MARKRDTGISLDSFLDILTCLQGVLMLIIITTGIDAAQTKVMVATPIELEGNERPIYIEARNNQLFLVPVDEARKAITLKQAEIIQKRRTTTDSVELMGAVGSADIDMENYVVDFSRYLGGQIALMPKEDREGYRLEKAELEDSTKWLGGIVSRMDKENERINFMVRDDSFEVFKLARYVAWTKDIKVTYSLIPRNEPLIF